MAMAVIQARLDEVVREQFGDSYSPYVEMWVDEDPDPQVLTYVYASGAPDRIDAIADIVVAEIADLASGGLSDAEFDVARAPVVERYSYVDNEQFLLQLRRAGLHDYDIDDFVFQDPELPGIGPSDVVDYIAEHVPTDQYVAAIVTPR